MLVGALVLSTVHRVLEEADAEEGQAGPSQQRHDAEEAVREVPTVEEEAMFAGRAPHEDRVLDPDRSV